MAGVSVGEEWYGGLNGVWDYSTNPPTLRRPYDSATLFPTLAAKAGDRIGQAEALRGLLEARHNEINVAFPAATYPNVYTVLVENAWNNDPTVFSPLVYFPPPRNLDVLGIDAYFGGDVLACDAGTKAQWDATITARVQWPIAQLPQPILLVAPAFRHKPNPDPTWPVAPAPCQMEWYYQLAASNAARIPALMWFAYGYDDNPGNVVEGVRHPALYDRFLKMVDIFARNYANRP